MGIISGRPIGSIQYLGGGNGHTLYQVVLPRSIYYAQSAEWNQLTTGSEPLPNGNTSFVGKCFVLQNTLWVIIPSYSASSGSYGSVIRGYSLETGEKVYDSGNITTFQVSRDFCATGHSYYAFFDIATDGDTTAYIVFNGSLYTFNAINQSLTQLYTGMTVTWTSYSPEDNDGYSNSSQNTNNITMPLICYSSYEKAVYIIGGIAFANYGNYSSRNPSWNSNIIYRWDCETSQMTTVSTTGWPGNCYGGFAYADPLTGDIYYGSASNQVIYKYSITSNTHTKIANGTFMQSVQASYFLVGDTMFYCYGSNLYPFNPMTGEKVEGQLPGISQKQVTTPGEIGVGDNALYRISIDYGIEKCDLFQSPPVDSPIVAKIYKGNKYHGITNWSVPSKLSVTTTQQEATQDIEIKMYEYGSQGGQIIYIET